MTPPRNGTSRSKQDSGKQKTKGGSSDEDFDEDDESGEDEDDAASAGSMEVMAAGVKNLIASSRLRSKAQNQQVKQSEMEERKEN